MKNLLFLAALSVGLIGCGQSGTGGPAESEFGIDSDKDFNRGETAGALGPTPAQTVEPIDPALENPDAGDDGSLTPSVPDSNMSDTNPPPVDLQAPVPDNSAGASLNEQGTQTTPEPFTRDDANPDAVNP